MTATLILLATWLPAAALAVGMNGCAVVWTDNMPLDMARELIALARAGRAA